MEVEISTLRKRLILWVGIISFILIIRFFVFQMFTTIGSSMEPTIPEGSIIFVNKIVYKFRKPERKEIIVFRTSDKPYVYFVKRVIGKEGETIKIINGEVFINGERIDEPYVVFNSGWNMPEKR